MAVDFATETYLETKGYLIDLVVKVHRKYGGDFEEWMAKANLFYMRALQKFDPNKDAKFATWVVFRVWKNMLDEIRKLAKESERMRMVGMPKDVADRHQEPFDVDEFCRELTQDARLAVRYALNPPLDVLLDLARKDSPARRRRAFKDFFKDLGWSLKRIKETFTEIGRALR